MLFEQETYQARKQERAKKQLHPYKPFVDPKNNPLAEKSLERWHDDRHETPKPDDPKSKTIDRLMKPIVSPRWLDQQKRLRDNKEMEDCTFKPQIIRSTSKKSTPKELQNRIQAVDDGVRLISRSTLDSKQSNRVKPLDLTRVTNNQDPMKFKSKDLMDQTGDIHNDLYCVSKKIEFVKPKVDRD